MTDLTAEEQKFFETGGEAEIPAKVEQSETQETGTKTEVKAEPEQKEDKAERTVPYGALHEERQLRKEAQKRNQEYEAKFKEFEGLKEQLVEWRRQQQAQKEQQEAEQDPLGYLQNQVSSLKQNLQTFEQSQTQTRQQQEEQQKFVQAVSSQVLSFTRDQPDYPKALQFVIEQRMKEYEAMGVADATTRQQLFDQEAVNIAQYAIANGVNPAEAVWNMAQARGWKAQPVQTNAADEKLDRIKAGMKQAKSVGTAGGSPDPELSLTDIESMSESDFDKLWNEMERSA